VRFLILNTDYPAFLTDLYARNPGLDERSYREQLEFRMQTLFGVADFYSFNLRALGHDAHDILMNNEPLQRSWALEQGEPPPQPRRARVAAEVVARKAWRALPRPPIRYGRRLLAWADRALDPNVGWLHGVLEQQVEHFRPDVVLNQDIGFIDAGALARMRRHYGLLVGQIASPIPEGQDFRHYDLMLSSLPNLVRRFRQVGVNAELHRLGFETRVLERLSPEDRSVSCSFVGSISPEHSRRLELLERLSKETPLEVWAPDVDLLARTSPIHARYRGHAWGIQMYRVLARSQITVNNHLDLAGSHANNLRLYEATGVGSLLLTDAKADLGEMFVPGQEVIAYTDSAECAKLIGYYLDNPNERNEIAQRGQRRTLQEHNYRCRMAELVKIVERYD
jgi:spore maturation protein CgeB